MFSSDEDGVTTDAVHVDTTAGLDIVQVDVAVLCDQVDDIIFGANLLERCHAK